jgi:hypothetical protein
MDCRAFRELHGDWVDDMLDPRDGDRLAGHVAECSLCARFDTLARRALIVARNAPPIEVSAEFSARLTSRIAEERRRRIAAHAPSRSERRVLVDARGLVWVRRAAAVAAVVGGSMVVRGAMMRAASTTAVMTGADASTLFASPGMSFQSPSATAGMMTGGLTGEIVVVRSMRPVGGALLPLSDDPLMDGSERGRFGETSATSVAATAPLWPTALMAAHAANRFAAMEFGDVIPVAAVQTPR